MGKITRTLLLSVLTVCVCTALVVGGTFALFTDTVEVNNHLVAGKLEVGMTRTAFSKNVLNTSGLMEVVKDDGDVDLVKDSHVLFDVTEAVPTSWYQADINIANQGSTAYDYNVRIIWANQATATDKDKAFASQVEITIISDKISDDDATGKFAFTDEDGEIIKEVNCVSFRLDKCNDEENIVSLGYMLKGASAETFTVRAEFVDSDSNNSAMEADLRFDVQVHATQKTSLD